MYDVCVIGAGPAGATVARLLSARYRVLLADPRPLGRRWHAGDLCKPCGGLLAPRAQAELAAQGLGVPCDVLTGPQLFAVRTRDLDAGLERLYQRFYVNVDREAFDRWLVSIVPPRVDVAWGWRAEAVDVHPDAPFVRFRTTGGGRAGVRARLVVGADGAASVVRRALLGPRRSARRYVAIQGRFSSGGGEPFYGAVFDAAVTDFYGWTIPKRSSVLVGVAVPSASGAVSRYEEFVAHLRQSGMRLGDELGREAALLLRPRMPADVALGVERSALVGEAAGLISPSSAEGISYALRSGAALARACDDGLDGVIERYRRVLQPASVEVVAKLAKSALIHDPTVRRMVMRSGIGTLGGHVPGPVSVADVAGL